MQDLTPCTPLCPRTVQGADTFFTIRSYLQTMTKQKQNLLQCLTSVFNGHPIQPPVGGVTSLGWALG